MSFKFDIVILKAHKVQMLMCYKNKKGLSEIREVHLRVHLADGSAPTLSTGRTTSSDAERTPETTERSKRAKGLA